MKFTIVRFMLLWALFVTAATQVGFAQSAQVTGRITDSTGAVIPAAQVAVTNEDTGLKYEVESNEVGYYTVPLLKPGNYRVGVQSEGFRPVSRTGISLEVDQVARIDFELEVGAVTETIEVVQTTPLLQTSTSSVGQVIEAQQVMDLPLNTRTAMGLIGLSAGVNVGRNFDPNRFNNANLFSASGSRPGQNEFLLDGAPNTLPGIWPGRGILGVTVPVDSIQEFKVQTNSFSAEYGRSGGGLVNTVSKSGGNDFHGSGFWFLRNSKMDANDFFANRADVELGSFKRNQFGGTIGGPIARNRSFFFANYQGTRSRSASNNTTTVPTADMKRGDFSAMTNKGKPVIIYDPLTTTTVGGNPIRTPFPGNVIPTDRINEVGSNMAGFYPDPNQPAFTNNLIQSASRPQNNDIIATRVDHSIANNHRIFGRFYYTRDDALNPDWYGNITTWGNLGLLQDVYSISAEYVYTISPTLLFNARYGYTQRTHQNLARSLGIDLTTLGFPSYVQQENEETIYPEVRPSGYGRQSWSNGINSFDYVTHSFQANATKMTSSHTLKFGGDIRFNSVPQDRGINLSGRYNFNTGYTRGPNANKGGANVGDSIASVLLGTPASGSFGTLLQVKGTNDYWSFYVQDDWRITPKLTLNLGVRYELERPRTEQYDRLDWFDFDVQSPLNGTEGVGTLLGGLRFASVDGNPRRHFDTDRNNLAPRFGFAYKLRSQTVLRGGYGIFYGSGSVGAAGWNIASQGYAPSTPFVGTVDGFKPITTLSDPFPDGFSQITGSSEGLMTLVGQNVARVFDRNAPLPYNQQWNVTIQNQFGGVLVEAGYIGSRGIHLGDGSGHLINQLPPENLALGTALQKMVPNPFYGIITNPGSLNKKTVRQGLLLRPYPHFGDMTIFNPVSAASTYHGFTAKAERRFASGVAFLVSYTTSKNISDAAPTVGDKAGHQNTYDRRADRSIVEEDIAQRFVASGSWQLPFGRGKAVGSDWNAVANGILGGWQINGIFSIQSGFPLRLTNTPNNLNAYGGTQRPSSTGFSAIKSGRTQDRLDEFLDPSAFTAPGPFNYGNVSRTLPDVRGPRFSNVDLSLFKTFNITEQVRLQFRAEFFNAFNSPMFNMPNTAFGGKNFGKITSQRNDPRQVQLALRLMF